MITSSEANFSQLLDHLFRINRHPTGREYSYSEVARAIEERFGERIDASYIARLRTGVANNPTRDVIALLCHHFHVTPVYFFPEWKALSYPKRPDPMLALKELMTRQGVPEQTTELCLDVIYQLSRLKEQHK